MKSLNPEDLRQLTVEEIRTLTVLAASRRAPMFALRAGIILASREGAWNQTELAQRFHTSRRTVRHWIERFEKEGMEVLTAVAPGRGRTSGQINHETRLRKLLASPPVGGEVWTNRLLAKETGIPVSTVNRVLQRAALRIPNGRFYQFDLHPRRLILGYYLDPPLRLIAVRRYGFESAPWEESEGKRLQKTVARLVQTILALETALWNSPKHAGRRDSLTRFLRGLSRVLGSGQFELWASHLDSTAARQLDAYPQLVVGKQNEVPDSKWLEESLLSLSRCVKTPTILAENCRLISGAIELLLEKCQHGKAKLYRPLYLPL